MSVKLAFNIKEVKVVDFDISLQGVFNLLRDQIHDGDTIAGSYGVSEYTLMPSTVDDRTHIVNGVGILKNGEYVILAEVLDTKGGRALYNTLDEIPDNNRHVFDVVVTIEPNLFNDVPYRVSAVDIIPEG